MNKKAVLEAYEEFAQLADAYLHIQDESHYLESLALIEELMSSEDQPEGLLDLLSSAVRRYEEVDDDLSAFESSAHEGPADVAMLRLLMDQHDLGVDDFPEIGHKTLVSKILGGSRNLTKKHIEALSHRFAISPAHFFDYAKP